MWLDDLKPGEGWMGPWKGLGHCGPCGALMESEQCPVCGDKISWEPITVTDGRGGTHVLASAREGAIPYVTHVLLGMMQREWDRPLHDDYWAVATRWSNRFWRWSLSGRGREVRVRR